MNMFGRLILFLKRSAVGRRWLNQRVTTIRFGIARGFKRYGGLGILGLLKPRQSAETLFLNSLALDGKCVYDVGASFGAFTLYFASRVGSRGRVITFDPLRKNCDAVEANLLLNDLKERVSVYCKGVGSASGVLRLAYRPDRLSTASFEPGISASLAATGPVAFLESEVVTLDEFVRVERLRLPDLVKIDVEGYELEVLKGMSSLLTTARPELFIELHGGTQPEKRAISRGVILYLKDFGYSIFHVESKKTLAGDTSDVDDSTSSISRGHIFCTSMLRA